ncbi:mercuric reductase [Ktedonobacter racemifer]|uniref:FAD-dependent pyridine nucleotide-disulfide oxidoreductase n=1 Tax=Ktedonobacter racemifer DSM 44963 TaxID=485913 RepID=D6TU10_KTERA|nr:mercuric reductase [Ktedonobacter racemifer]EFH83911.1 FAD-dependent pyridine nucleotide-disulfide oxidoreductase [Ktedonobacter racemifer DSM 44963]
MAEIQTYDAIVIGAGQGGGPLASALEQSGKKVAMVEREHVGGTCVNEGCTPTKTMVASARVAYLARRGADYGVSTGPVSVDIEVVRKRKRDIVDSFRSGSERRLVSSGVDLLMGEGEFTGPKRLRVTLNDGGVREIEAETIIINTGLRPATPPLEGIATIPTLNSTSIMELDSVPEHLLVIGGGYIGLEFGQMFRRFGSQVTVIQRGARLLSREDKDVAEEVAKILREDGIEILLQTKLKRVTKDASGKIHLTVETPEGERTLVGSHLLLASGRVPNTDKLNLAATDVEANEHGLIQVNDKLETNVSGIYAIGDVKGGPAFTHISYDDFRILRTNLIENGNASIKDRLLPYTVFIDPQLGRVGLSEEEARKQGLDIRVAKMPMSYVARALETDESRGFMKAIVDPRTKQILGAAVLGLEGGEVMAMLQIAMMGKLPYTALRDGVFSHPNLSESLNNLFSMLDQ